MMGSDYRPRWWWLAICAWIGLLGGAAIAGLLSEFIQLVLGDRHLADRMSGPDADISGYILMAVLWAIFALVAQTTAAAGAFSSRAVWPAAALLASFGLRAVYVNGAKDWILAIIPVATAYWIYDSVFIRNRIERFKTANPKLFAVTCRGSVQTGD